MNKYLKSLFNKTMSKVIFTILAIILIYIYSVNIYAETIPLDELRKAEEMLYGNVSEAAVLQRVDTLELALFGVQSKGSLVTRSQDIVDYVLPDESNSSLTLLVPYMEWTLYNKVQTGSLIPRIEGIERAIFGDVQQDALITRVEKLSSLLIPDDETLFQEIAVTEGVEIHIQTEEEINSDNIEEGKEIPFTVRADLKIDEYLVVPAGTTGTLNINEIKEAGNFGRDGSLKISINDIGALDGSKLSLNLKLDDQENYSQEIAVGVSLLSTVIISNPVGLVAGFFYKGKDVVIPAGSVMMTQIIENASVYGIKLY
ncbi:MAG: hypothetical protein ACLFUI_06890 [Halanaerobiales bacterium]